MRCSLRKVVFTTALLAISPFAAAQSATLPKPLFKSFINYPIEGQNDIVAIATADLNGDGHPDVAALYSGLRGAATVAILLNNGNGTFRTAVSYPAGPVSPIAFGPMSIAIGDVNGDGKPDLVATSLCLYTPNICNTPQAGFLAVLLGNGDGTFKSPVGYSLAPMVSGGAVRLADFNGDGFLDIAVIGATQTDNLAGGAVSILLNDGKGHFHVPTVYSPGGNIPTSIVAADVNRDGYPDLIVDNQYSQSFCSGDSVVAILLNDRKGGFLPAVDYDSGGATSCDFSAIAVVADFDQDGNLDIAALNPDGNGPSTFGVLRGNGDGTFQPALTHPFDQGYGTLIVADINHDGKPDLVGTGCSPAGCANRENFGIYVLLGYGDGTFQSPYVYPGSHGNRYVLSAADVNGDGRADLLVDHLIANSSTYEWYVAVGLGELAPTRTTLTSSLNPSVLGRPVTFTATVTSTDGPIPDGEKITFHAGTTELGTRTTVSGVAKLTTSTLAAKTYTIKATYSGDNVFKTSSGSVNQIVNP